MARPRPPTARSAHPCLAELQLLSRTYCKFDRNNESHRRRQEETPESQPECNLSLPSPIRVDHPQVHLLDVAVCHHACGYTEGHAEQGGSHKDAHGRIADQAAHGDDNQQPGAVWLGFVVAHRACHFPGAIAPLFKQAALRRIHAHQFTRLRARRKAYPGRTIVRTSGSPSLAFSSPRNTGAMPSVSCSWIRQVRLWERILQRTSLTMPASVRLMTQPPNFLLIAE